MKVKDIIKDFPEKTRKELETMLDSCMKSICCEKVVWRDFEVYDSSVELMSNILQNLAIEFLVPIAEEAEKKPERNIIILCNTSKEEDDNVWFVNRSASKIYATITLSTQTAKMLSAKTNFKKENEK